MNNIHRAIITHRHNLLQLTPLIQSQHASSYTYTSTTKSALRTPKSPKNKSPSPPLNDIVLKEPPKPSEIPWQAKVVNSVNLIGQVKVPVQFEKSPDGKNWAGTIISQDDASLSSASLPSFWIPVIFEGDLAHVAKCHLKEKDYVHVAGYLSVDVPPFKLSDVQANVQVMVHSINFVQDSKSTKVSTPREPEKWSTKTSVPENNGFAQLSMKEPETMSIQPHTLFEKSMVNTTESSPVHNSTEVGRKSRKVDKRSMLANWRDLATNSKQWLDNRDRKQKGLVKANYPDFKHKDTGDGLWLDNAPPEILQGLGQLEFSALPTKAGYFRKPDFPATPAAPCQTPSGRSSSSGTSREKDGESWKHLVENPKQWWDNRLDKKNKKGPDFKNKDSGKALWLGDAPAWAASSLPPLKS